MINGSVPRWRSVTSGVLQTSVQALMFFSIFISYIDSGIECALNKSVEDTQIRNAVNTCKRKE